MASLESGEIAGIAVTFTVIAVVLLVLVLVFLVRHRNTSDSCATAILLTNHNHTKRGGEAGNSNGIGPNGTTSNGNGQTEVNGKKGTVITNGHALHQMVNKINISLD